VAGLADGVLVECAAHIVTRGGGRGKRRLDTAGC
jgi:hypothetical protein